MGGKCIKIFVGFFGVWRKTLNSFFLNDNIFSLKPGAFIYFWGQNELSPKSSDGWILQEKFHKNKKCKWSNFLVNIFFEFSMISWFQRNRPKRGGEMDEKTIQREWKYLGEFKGTGAILVGPFFEKVGGRGGALLAPSISISIFSIHSHSFRPFASFPRWRHFRGSFSGPPFNSMFLLTPKWRVVAKRV